LTRTFASVASLLALLVAAWVGYQALFEGLGRTSLLVASVEGRVARDHEGTSVTMLPGETLDANDRIRAGEGGRAVLEAGDGARLVLDAGADVQVVAIARDEVRVALEGGRLRATVRPEGPRVAVGAGAGAFTIRDADATLARDGDVVAIEVERGSVEAGVGSDVSRLEAGNRMTVAGGEADIDDANEALLLTLADPPATTRGLDLEVRGRTYPRARVRAGQGGAWRDARADANGAFALRVPLREGTNVLTVESTDVLGRAAQQEVRVVRDTRAPVLGVEVQLR
jgi:hypothetical protein